MTKIEKLNRLMEKGLLQLGAIKKDSCSFDLQSKYGAYHVYLSTPRSCRGKNATMSVCSRFDEPEKAKNGTDCNPYSGKMNFTVFANDYSVEDFARIVLGDIESILDKSDTSYRTSDLYDRLK